MDALDQLLEEILETDVSPGTLQLVLSKLKERGRTDLVIQQGRKALSSHPEHMGLRALLAEAYMEAGLSARAAEEMEHVILQLDEMAVLYRRLAEAYLLQRREAEAARCLSIYLAHRPDDVEARETLDRLTPESAEEAVPEDAPAEGVAVETGPEAAPLEGVVLMPEAEPEPLEAALEEAVAVPEPQEAPEAAPEDAEAEPEFLEAAVEEEAGEEPEAIEPAMEGTEAGPEPLEAALEEAVAEPEPQEAPEAASEDAEAEPEFLKAAVEEEAGAEPEPGQDLPEIATHTLAELYYNQGQVEAAMETYKTILSRDPADEQARARLQELEGLSHEEEAPAPEVSLDGSAEPPPVDPERRRTEKMIAVLEQWLNRIQETRPGASA